MKQPHRGLLAAEPVAATIHGVGLAPALAPGIQAIEIPAVATEAPGTRQQWCPAPARELPTALDIGSRKRFAAAPVLAAIRETLARGGIKKPIRRRANLMGFMAEPGGAPGQQGIGTYEASLL